MKCHLSLACAGEFNLMTLSCCHTCVLFTSAECPDPMHPGGKKEYCVGELCPEPFEATEELEKKGKRILKGHKFSCVHEWAHERHMFV